MNAQTEVLAAELAIAHEMTEHAAAVSAQAWEHQVESLHGYWKLDEDDRVKLRTIFMHGWLAGHASPLDPSAARN